MSVRATACRLSVGLTLGLLLLLSARGAEVGAQRRADAAARTAENATVCKRIQPFYWEIGDRSARLAGGAVHAAEAPQMGPDAHTNMMIASASKWIYSAYVAERRHGALTEEDVLFLTFRSGYTRFRWCNRSQTVQECQTSLANSSGEPDPATRGRFDYSGGHMQKHAVLLGLGALHAADLAAEIRGGLNGVLGPTWSFSYAQAQLAGGGMMHAADYAAFLRALMSQQLQLGVLLGRDAVCASLSRCPELAAKTPIPASEAWTYSLGHWVESDPTQGDGSFSSPGAFGFYPWISHDRQYYGIVAREDRHGLIFGAPEERPGIESVQCGRRIRAAWLSGVPRLD